MLLQFPAGVGGGTCGTWARAPRQRCCTHCPRSWSACGCTAATSSVSCMREFPSSSSSGPSRVRLHACRCLGRLSNQSIKASSVWIAMVQWAAGLVKAFSRIGPMRHEIGALCAIVPAMSCISQYIFWSECLHASRLFVPRGLFLASSVRHRISNRRSPLTTMHLWALERAHPSIEQALLEQDIIYSDSPTHRQR